MSYPITGLDCALDCFDWTAKLEYTGNNFFTSMLSGEEKEVEQKLHVKNLREQHPMLLHSTNLLTLRLPV